MTGFLVDTNVLSELTRPRPDERVRAFLVNIERELTFISVVTLGEICIGIAGHQDETRRADLQMSLDTILRPWFAGRLLPITESIAERWGVLTGERKRMGRPVPSADGMVAATALVHGLTLVTRNVKHFEDFNIPIINPWTID